MIKYCVNGKFVDEETFYIALRKYYDATHQPFTYTSYLEKLKTDGCIRLEGKAITYEYHYFYIADEQVFEIAQIVAENEFDPLDGDAFYVAFAIYQNGFRKQGGN